MKVESKPRPERGNYRVHIVNDDLGVIVAVVTVYDDYTKTFEFDSDRRYHRWELEALLGLSSGLTST